MTQDEEDSVSGMSDLHAAIAAALDREQALAEDALTTVDEHLLPTVPPTPWHNPDVIWRGLRTSWSRAAHIAAHDPARTLRRVEADRRVLARHSPPLGACDWCALWPDCPELLDLAARYDVEPTR